MTEKRGKHNSNRIAVTFTSKQIEILDRLKESGVGRNRPDVVNKLVIQWLIEHKKLEE